MSGVDEPYGIAAVQMVSVDDVDANLARADALLAQARAAGARLAVLPENFGFLGASERDKLGVAEAEGDGPMQAFLAGAAERHGLTVVGGTVPIRGADPERVRAASPVYGPDGRRLSRYDKLHLFDVVVSESESYRESATLEPGQEPVQLRVDGLDLGLAVCYDLRFPEQFRAMAAAGMDLLALPSAFTQTTGAAHWEVLVRARAVENLCYVVAANQGGEHPGGRRTYGHSMVVGPWGDVLASCQTGEGVAVAQLNRTTLGDLRRRFPALGHRRL